METSILFFLISPFIGLIQAFKNFKEAWAKNALWFFVVFFGFTMFLPPGSDADRYTAKLEILHNSPVTWNSFSSSFFAEDEDGEVSYDIYEPTVIYVLSLFSNNPHLLFGVFASVFGYFFSRNIGFLFDIIDYKVMNLYLWIVLISFVVTIGFWELLTVRMWTAAHVFFYGGYSYFIKNNRNGLFYVLGSVLIHYSFALPVSLFLFYFIFRIPYIVLFVIFIASFFISEINLSSLGSNLENILPKFLAPKVKSYTDEEYGETIVEYYSSMSWYMVYFRKCLGWFITIFITYIFFEGKKVLKEDLNFRYFYSFTLLFLAIGNIMTLVPSGSRYLQVADLFAISTIFLFLLFNMNDKVEKWLQYTSPLLLFFILVSLRMSLDAISFLTIFSNPIMALFLDLPLVSILNTIK